MQAHPVAPRAQTHPDLVNYRSPSADNAASSNPNRRKRFPSVQMALAGGDDARSRLPDHRCAVDRVGSTKASTRSASLCSKNVSKDLRARQSEAAYIARRRRWSELAEEEWNARSWAQDHRLPFPNRSENRLETAHVPEKPANRQPERAKPSEFATFAGLAWAINPVHERHIRTDCASTTTTHPWSVPPQTTRTPALGDEPIGVLPWRRARLTGQRLVPCHTHGTRPRLRNEGRATACCAPKPAVRPEVFVHKRPKVIFN